MGFLTGHRPNHSSFHRLRSFHLASGGEEGLPPVPTLVSTPRVTHSPSFSPTPPRTFLPPRSLSRSHSQSHSLQASAGSRRKSVFNNWRVPRNGSVPIPAGFIITFGCVVSLLFIITLACTFRGADAGDPPFKALLNSVAKDSPGLVLIGDNVDVDVDEPAITIRWSIVACGASFMLPGSNGTHGSQLCGLPSVPLDIFVDGEESPTASYDPLDIPFSKETGLRRSIQNLVQFDSDHVLDVHKARLYPFDSYFLSSSIRIASPSRIDNTSTPLPIQKLATLDEVTNFVIQTTDVSSYELNAAEDSSAPTRDIDMTIRRPGEARTITLLLFGVCWILTHVSVGHVFLARRLTSSKSILKHLAAAGAILVVLPHIRDSMPDAPGLDGILIDTIGFFPQMIITGLCIVALLLIVVSRELAGTAVDVPLTMGRGKASGPSSSLSIFTGEKPRAPVSHSEDPTRYEMDRVVKHLRGQYVFPPLPPIPQSPTRDTHRRVMTAIHPKRDV